MFDVLESGSCPDGTMSNPDDTGPTSVPLERLEAQICELAGHLAAATCRFLVLLGDFDARRGWASWEMTSCAAWLSWKCQMSSGTAREHVRVARALRDLPVIRGEFGAGRLSYAKVRALTRIATPATEADLAELAGPMTGNQLERERGFSLSVGGLVVGTITGIAVVVSPSAGQLIDRFGRG